MNKVYGISLGPGDPELLTLKALRILKDSDIVFYPGSLFSDGRKESYVLPMLTYHQVDPKKLEGFFLQMTSDRSAAENTYEETAIKIEAAYREGKKISIVCEGDLSFYASFSYLLSKIQEQNIPIELVPGINSFSLGAALHQVPVGLQSDKVVIVPLATNIQEIEQYYQEFDTIILMKIRLGWKALYPELTKKNWKFYYCERLGSEGEFISQDLNELATREIPYFALLIIKK